MKSKLLQKSIIALLLPISLSALAVNPSIDPANSSYSQINIGASKIGVQSMWLYSPSTSNPLSFASFSNNVYTSMAATFDRVYLSYCSPEASEAYLLEFDEASGNQLRQISLSGLPASTVAVSDIFTDSEGNLCGCSKAFDGVSAADHQLAVYEITADGSVANIHYLDVSNKNDVVSSCTIVGDITGEFSVWAAGLVGSDVRLLYWATPTTKVKAYSTGLQSNSDFNTVEPIDDTHLYLSTEGNNPQLVEIGESLEMTGVSAAVKRSCRIVKTKVSGIDILCYLSSCSKSADVKFTVSLDVTPPAEMWTLPAGGLGYKSVCQSPQASVAKVIVNDYETHFYLYSVGIGLAAYSVYDVDKGGVVPVGDSVKWRIDGNTVDFADVVNATVYNAAGREMMRLRDVRSVSLDALTKGVYVVVTDDGARVKLANR